VEIFQNCPIFNDDAFDYVRDDKEGVNRIVLRDGEPIRWGADHEKGLRQRADGSIEVCAGDDPNILVHDASHPTPSLAFALSRVTQERDNGTPVGVFRNIDRPVYDDLMSEQLETAVARRGPGELAALLHSGETWTIS
jgi:2-oxoglutarate ferredoxin oxidoreductase subunit beta